MQLCRLGPLDSQPKVRKQPQQRQKRKRPEEQTNPDEVGLANPFVAYLLHILPNVLSFASKICLGSYRTPGNLKQL